MKRWLVRAVLALAALYVLAGTLAWLIPLESKRAMLTNALTPSNNWQVSIGEIRLNLWTGLAAEVDEIRLYRDRPGSRLEVLSIESARLTWPLRSLFLQERALHVRIDSPHLLVAYAFDDTIPPGAPTTHAEATGLVQRQVLEAPDWRTLRTVAGGLIAMQLSLTGAMKELGPQAHIDEVEIRDGRIEISFPPLLGGEAVALVMEDLNLIALAPRTKRPGALWAGGAVRVGAERRDLFASGIIETSHGDTPAESEYVIPALTLQVGEVAMQTKLRMGGDLSALAREASELSDSSGAPPPGDSAAADPAAASAEPPLPGTPPDVPAEQFGELSLKIAENVESLGPLWMPLMAPGFEWKLLGGIDLAFSMERRSGKVRSAFSVDLGRTGVLRVGWFHKPENIPMTIKLTSARDQRSSSVIGVEAEVADLRVEMGGIYRDEGERAASLQFHGSADSLTQLAPLIQGGFFETSEPSGLKLKGEMALSRWPVPRAEIRLAELSMHAGNSDVHVVGDIAIADQLATDLYIGANELIPSDWLSALGRDALGPVGAFTKVPLDKLETRLITDRSMAVIRGIRAMWAGGELQGHGRYVRSSCRGEGQVALIRASLGDVAATLGNGPVVEGLREARLSVLGEVGRDLPCTGGSYGPIEAWGANLEVFAENMYLPVLSAVSNPDVAALASVLSANFDPVPEIREGKGTLRWQGRRARLENFRFTAKPLEVTVSGEVGTLQNDLDLSGELVGPIKRAGMANSLFGGLFAKKSTISLPVTIRGTLSAPEILLETEGLNLREIYRQNQSEEPAPDAGMALPQAPEEEDMQIPQVPGEEQNIEGSIP